MGAGQYTEKLLGYDHRNWMNTGFLNDFKRLVRNKIGSIQKDLDEQKQIKIPVYFAGSFQGLFLGYSVYGT